MGKETKKERSEGEGEFIRRVGEQEKRKLRAQRKKMETVWFGLGMFGIVGWSIVVPTLLGIALGIWLDKHHPGPHSWTLALLVAGLMLGCANAWHWVAKEEKEIRKMETENGDDDSSDTTK